MFDDESTITGDVDDVREKKQNIEKLGYFDDSDVLRC